MRLSRWGTGLRERLAFDEAERVIVTAIQQHEQ